MFDRGHIPSQNPQLEHYLNNVYNQAGAPGDVKAIIERKFEKVESVVKDKIINTVTVSAYLDQLWKQADLKQKHKDLVIVKLEAIQNAKKDQIKKGEQQVAKEPSNLDIVNAKFQMTPFEEFNYQEKVKDIKKKKQLNIDSDLFARHVPDLEVLHALNRPFRSVSNLQSSDIVLHYTGGLCDANESDTFKKVKAEEFVKKIKEDRKAFVRKMKQIEKTAEDREQEELERYKQLQQEEEERKLREKKQRLEAHITELKAKGDERVKEKLQWEEDYKALISKKPLFKEIEEKFNKGHVIPELEDRKKKLQEIRNFYKPIPKEALIEHEQKVIKMLEDRSLERKEPESNKWSYQKPAYESKHHKSYAEELLRARKQKEEEQLEKIRKKERVMELMQEVKEKHQPKADPQKELELMQIIEKLKKRRDGRSWTAEDKDEEKDPKKLGEEYFKAVKEMVQKKKRELKLSQTKEDLASEKGVISELGLGGKMTTNSIKSEPVAPKKVNYLSELRKDNKIQSRNNKIDLIIKNGKLDTKEKKDLLQTEIEKLDERAKRKELVRKHKVKKGIEDIDVDDDDEYDQLYVNSIKAKLQMLGSNN